MTRIAITGLIGMICVTATSFIWWRFVSDMKVARARAEQGSVLIATPCGPIEYEDTGVGVPLLAIHGSGGGYDQGMSFARPLIKAGVRVVAMSRFGYLRTPLPIDGSSAAAQADVYVCLLDALHIPKAAVMGGSAGAPSALQMAIRHPNRVGALILLVPLTFKPITTTDSAPPMAPWVEGMMMRVVGSDFLYWAALHVSRDTLVKFVLATPPELLKAASSHERARVNSILDNILPVSSRAGGLRADTAAGKQLKPLPLESIRAPTLIISARDDRYGTFASAQYTADRIAGSKFVGFDHGGHTWVGHDDEVQSEIVKLVRGAGTQ